MSEAHKRRTTRIVQAIPLTVSGVDALGRPFQERTSSLIINCHGCRYQSKHYVLKNMWVTMEIPHPKRDSLPAPFVAKWRGFKGRELYGSFFKSRLNWKFPETFGASRFHWKIGLC